MELAGPSPGRPNYHSWPSRGPKVRAPRPSQDLGIWLPALNSPRASDSQLWKTERGVVSPHHRDPPAGGREGDGFARGGEAPAVSHRFPGAVAAAMAVAAASAATISTAGGLRPGPWGAREGLGPGGGLRATLRAPIGWADAQVPEWLRLPTGSRRALLSRSGSPGSAPPGPQLLSGFGLADVTGPTPFFPRAPSRS